MPKGQQEMELPTDLVEVGPALEERLSKKTRSNQSQTDGLSTVPLPGQDSLLSSKASEMGERIHVKD